MVSGPVVLRDGVSAPSGDVVRALERGRAHLLSLQDPRGWWKGELQTNVTMDAEDILLREFLGIRESSATERSAVWIRSQQRDDGSWSNFHGGPGDLSTTIEAYVALRLAGDRTDAAHMRSAALFARSAGGVEQARVFTHIWLALFGAWPWQHVPELPPELMLLPAWAPLSIYDFACWARQTVVALSIVLAMRPTRALPFKLDELRGPRPWTRARGHSATTRALAARRSGPGSVRTASGAPAPRGRAGACRALDRAPAGGRRIVGRHPAAVGLFADRPAPARYPLEHPVIRAGLDGLDRFTVEEETKPPPGGVSVAGLGHRARDGRAGRRRGARR